MHVPPRLNWMSLPAAPAPPEARRVALVLGLAQTLAWGLTYYLPAMLAPAVVAELGAEPALVYGAFSVGVLISGLAAPRTGVAIGARGGRPVLLLSALILAAGLVLLGLLPGLWGWGLGWVVLGFGMALGLYEAAFATLGQLYGRAARGPITLVTLCAGFASTLGWPLSAALLPLLGWRGTCLAYAAVLLLVLPSLYLLVPQHRAPGPASAGTAAEAGDAPMPAAWMRRSLLLLAGFFTLRALVTGTMAVHLIAVLGGLGLSVGMAVGAAALMGPAQVGGRLLDVAFGRVLHPLDAARLGGALLPAGAVLLLLAGPVAAVPFVLLYGASNGILTISRGAVPLALFGPRDYPALMGRLALPILVVQAGAPTLAAPLVAGLPAVKVLGLAGLLALLALLCLLPLRRAP